MGLFFEDMMYERQATATLGYAIYGGSEPGECLATVLKSPKEMLHFTEAEGAGDRCEQMARSLFHQKSFDWLDEMLGTNAT